MRKPYPPGRTTAAGYGQRHQALRRQWTPKVATGTVPCWRCGKLIGAGEPWDLGHDDYDRTITRGPEHRGRCNRAAAARKLNHLRRRAARTTVPNPSRDW